MAKDKVGKFPRAKPHKAKDKPAATTVPEVMPTPEVLIQRADGLRTAGIRLFAVAHQAIGTLSYYANKPAAKAARDLINQAWALEGKDRDYRKGPMRVTLGPDHRRFSE
jgi:hypothetical protein